jgi:hypothetical protein
MSTVVEAPKNSFIHFGHQSCFLAEPHISCFVYSDSSFDKLLSFGNYVNSLILLIIRWVWTNVSVG